MDEHKLESTFGRLKKEMPINNELKQNLRKSFQSRPKIRWPRLIPAVLTAAAACLALIVFILAPGDVLEKANAASLKIFNQVSFVEIGGGVNLGATEYNGTVYVPAENGLFAYSKQGFTKLSDQGFGFVRVSPDGKKLVLSSGGNLSIYDLETKKTEELLKGDGFTVFYEQPAWAPDGNKIIYTKKIIEWATPDSHGFTEKESGIYEIDLKTRTSKKLADGSYASYVKGTDNIIFEREQKIISKNTADSSERIIDSGRFPSVSPDGSYVAYVKAALTQREAAKNATVSESIEDVWIADTGELGTKRQVTSNYVNKFISEEEWLKNLPSSDLPQNLAYSGMYSYYDPSWSSDSESLFILKNRNVEAKAGMRLMRVDFATDPLTARDIMQRFMQALIVRDEDYARSLMENPPGILTISNPHPVGYKTIASGNKDGREYVDMEISFAYTAQPYYSAAKNRFYLQPGNNGYFIRKAEDLNGSISLFEKDGSVYLDQGGQKQLLFSARNLPKDILPKGNYRFASLAYSNETDSLIFSIQVLKDQEQEASVKLISYNLKEKDFRLVDEITRVSNKANVAISNLVLDPKGQFAAVDLFSEDDKSFSGHVFVYNLVDGTKVKLGQQFKNTSVSSVRTTYWNSENLVFTLNSGSQTMGYIYDPIKKEINNL